jgi:uncharacterized caspase-like protein
MRPMREAFVDPSWGPARRRSRTGKLRAVVVGVDRYRDPAIAPLSCAAADAKALAGLIEGRIDPAERKVRLLVNEHATRQNVMGAIGDDLADEVEKDDVVLVYFAGHGSPERRSVREARSHYLVPHDAEHARVYSTCIDLDRDVGVWLERLANAKLVVLFFDTCFSGAAGGRTFMGPLLASTPKMPPDISMDDRPLSIKELDLGRGRVVFCAADSDQLASEDLALGHGVFTYHLLRVLARGDESSGKTIDLTDLYAQVEVAVRQATEGAQEPVVSMLGNVRAKLPRFG